MGRIGVPISESVDVSISCNNNPSLDRKLLCIFAYVCQLRRPSFV